MKFIVTVIQHRTKADMEASVWVAFACLLSFGSVSSATVKRHTVFEHLSKFSDQDCVTDAYPPSEREVPWEVVNLDLPPEQRYNDLVSKRIDELKNLLHYIKNFTSFILDGKLFGYIDTYLGPLAETLPDPYGKEIKGLATATNISLGEIVLYNIFYEVFTVCTSIVAEDKSGNLFHARNLDFGLFLGWDVKNDTWMLTEILRTLIVNIDYQRNGKTVYKTVSFAGYVGVLSGVKPGILTLTLNERFNIDGGYIGIVEWILGMRNSKWSSFLTRDVLESATSFEEAKDMLANDKVLAPVYYILGGTKSGEGVVITRSRTECLNQMSLNPANNTWFVLETNYDNWKPPLLIDDRRTPGRICMNKMGQEAVSFKGLYNVLSTQPVLNKLTTYTTLMQASTGKVETYIRFCADPCFPW
ncbi:acid ceramidase-like [Pocillopora damicornis]|uniref:acid ceramidase-like n=1 Tax=Pocillopora damicornis TaxID=46731 RepID=UPI000F55113B|nr:acid ceramidase-like [Pocillopora damicornis]